MVTAQQVKEYLTTLGIALPDFLVDLLIAQVAGAEECLQKYDPATRALIQLYLLSLLAMAQGDKYISSQSAPSGASRSFRYHNFHDLWKSRLTLLTNLDKYGCVTELVPEDPFTNSAGLWVSGGGCYERNR